MYFGNLSEATARIYAALIIIVLTLMFLVFYGNRQKLGKQFTQYDRKLGDSAFRGRTYVKIFRYICLSLVTIFFVYSVDKANNDFWAGIPFYLIVLPSIILMYVTTLIKWENRINTNRDIVIAILIVFLIVFQVIAFVF
jgi:hypothetical protein